MYMYMYSYNVLFDMFFFNSLFSLSVSPPSPLFSLGDMFAPYFTANDVYDEVFYVYDYGNTIIKLYIHVIILIYIVKLTAVLSEMK